MPNWTNPPNTDDLDEFVRQFAAVCLDVAVFAEEIGETFWAKRFFRPAYMALSDEHLSPKQRLTIAIDKTHVFGGMGSWLDSPPFSAADQQKTATFNALTDALYEYRTLAIKLI